MAFYSIPLKAGVPHVQDIAGALILVDGIDGATGVDVTPFTNGSRQVTMPGRKAGFKYRTPYDAVELRAVADCTVRIFLTNNDVSLGFTDGAQVNVLGSVQVTNGADNRLPVDLAGGSVTVTADNVGINNDDSKPVPVRQVGMMPMPHAVPTTVAQQAVKIASASAVVRKRIFRNSHLIAVVALGGADVTLDRAAIVLFPGDAWEETDAAGAEWYAISDTAGVSVPVMEFK